MSTTKVRWRKNEAGLYVARIGRWELEVYGGKEGWTCEVSIDNVAYLRAWELPTVAEAKRIALRHVEEQGGGR